MTSARSVCSVLVLLLGVAGASRAAAQTSETKHRHHRGAEAAQSQPAAADEPASPQPTAAESASPASAEPAAASSESASAAVSITAEPAAEPAVEPAPSADSDEDSAVDEKAHTGLVLGAKLGGGLGLGAFGAAPALELELGFLLPLPQPVGRSLELFVTGQYLQPTTDGTTSAADPRLPGNGTLHYSVTQQELPLTFGAMYRVPLPTRLFMPYAAAGARLYLLRTRVSGTAGGQTFGPNQETASKAGAYFALGADFFVGPGALLAELQLGYAGINGFVMRDTNVGTFSLAVGYRLML